MSNKADNTGNQLERCWTQGEALFDKIGSNWRHLLVQGESSREFTPIVFSISRCSVSMSLKGTFKTHFSLT